MKLLVFDGNSIVNRAFYAVKHLSASNGMMTNAIFGFLNIMFKFIEEENPDGLCVAFDLAAPTFRHKQYDGYKATRHGMPDELAEQMPVLKQVLDAMRITRLEKEGYEADDIIGTLAHSCDQRGDECIIVTGDRDDLQLVSEKTRVDLIITRMRRTETTVYTPEKVVEVYGVPAQALIDVKALMGDSSDNVPGVAGIGEKTALSLIRKFGSLDGVYANLDDASIKAKMREKLEKDRDMAYLSRQLVTIDINTPLDTAIEQMTRKPYDRPALRSVLTRLEFTSFIKKLGLDQGDAGLGETPAEKEKITALTLSDLAAAKAALNGCEKLAFYPEEKDLSALCFCAGEVVYHAGRLDFAAGEYDQLLSLLSSGKYQVCVPSAKEVYRAMAALTLPCADLSFDTSVAGYLLDPSDANYEVGTLAAKYLGKEQEADAACLCATLFELWPVLADKLEQDGMKPLYTATELPLTRVLAEMEEIGFRVDKQALTAYGCQLDETLQILTAEIYRLAGEEFNINSTKQLAHILFEKLGLPPVKKTKTGYSTNVEVLEKLKGTHEIIEALLDYRQLSKLKSTYADGLLKVIGSDGRIHSSFQQTVTQTGRLSSTDPNLQNIPVRQDVGRLIRRMFVARDADYVLVDADYSQIELRILAAIAEDQTMIGAFASGADIHRATAAQVFDTPFEQVSSKQRSEAKAVNFGIVYGIGEFSLSEQLGIPIGRAREYIASYFAKYPKVKAYMDHTVKQAYEHGYVTTLFGRRRYLPELAQKNRNIRAFGERVAMNMPIQGTAADIMKIAMVRVWQRLRREGLKSRLILQVHDELIVETYRPELSQVMEIVKYEMEHAADLAVRLTADASSGENWDEAKG